MSTETTDQQLLQTMNDPQSESTESSSITFKGTKDNDDNAHSPLAFLALILITTLFLSAIIFQSNTSDTDHSNLMASKLSNAMHQNTKNWPIVVSTWNFVDAVEIGFDAMMTQNNSLSAILSGCSYCEYNPWDCGWSVGYGAKPDSVGEVTLDALIMYGPTHSAGGVGGLRNIKNAIGVANAVMQHTTHTLLVGESATKFAIMMGFKAESLSTLRSKKIYRAWKENDCQPNAYINLANTNISCPPYEVGVSSSPEYNEYAAYLGHDTIGMIAMDESGAMSVGTSTNGLRYKIHGRVGDAAVVGHGAYVQQGIGAAVATGNGDVMMLYAPTRIAVHNMQNGMNVHSACDSALNDIVKDARYLFEGALICMDANGNFAASKHMNRPFHFVYKDKSLQVAKMLKLS